MLAIIENLLSRDSSRNHSHVTLGRFPTLQAYSVQLKEIASIYSPIRIWIVIMITSIFCSFYDQDCKNFWSRSFLSLEAYWVPVIIIIAIICGPALYLHWSWSCWDLSCLEMELLGTGCCSNDYESEWPTSRNFSSIKNLVPIRNFRRCSFSGSLPTKFISETFTTIQIIMSETCNVTSSVTWWRKTIHVDDNFRM